MLGFIYLIFNGKTPESLLFPKHQALRVWVYVAAAITSVGILFKVLHWPYSAFLFSIGILAIILWLLAEPFFKKRTSSISGKSYDTLDENLVSPEPHNLTRTSKRENSSLTKVEQRVSVTSAIFLLSGTICFFLETSMAGILLGAGFLTGIVFVFMTFRS